MAAPVPVAADPTALIVAGIALVSTLASVWLTNRYATRAMHRAQEEARAQLAGKVDAEAYDRARKQYDAALAEQENRIRRIGAARDEDAAEYDRDRAELSSKLASTRADLRALRLWARDLLRSLRARGVAYPAPPVRLGDTDPEGFTPLTEERA